MAGRRDRKRKLKDAMRGLLLFIPRMLKLTYRLLRDKRVSKADKTILAGAILYVIVPLDLSPDFLPFIGQVDDSLVLALALLRLLNSTDAHVVWEHWDGEFDIKKLALSITEISRVFLPKRVHDHLVGKHSSDRSRLKVIEGGAK